MRSLALRPRSFSIDPGRAVPTLAAALCLYLCSLPALAQTYNGRVLGTVTDQSGAVVVGANIDVTDVQRGTTRSAVTGAAGDYVVPSVPPGVYKIAVRATNFRSVERPNVQVEVAQDARVDFTLQPGQASETVVVTEEVPLINTTSSTLGGTLSNKQINDLPLNGRNYENLLQLRPGVMRYPGGGFSTTSANGLRAEDNAYIIDGL
ncbi:MAG TPA: carboxypeptidase-like regulatory domain-containing protein, partial [Terriglobales bacterium]|nr:carboxypeptidase-like regulatory domain-containing protein [Terriglobales bacterium]